MLRKFYGGNGGALPPTDPRILEMTEAQIDVEFEHMLIDKAERDAASGVKVYTDEDYDAEEAEEERIDSRIFIEEDDFEGDDDPLPEYENDDNDSEWVDDEIDDDEGY